MGAAAAPAAGHVLPGRPAGAAAAGALAQAGSTAGVQAGAGRGGGAGEAAGVGPGAPLAGARARDLSRLPPDAPARVRSAMEAAAEYRRRRADAVAAAARAAAAAAAPAPGARGGTHKAADARGGGAGQ